MVIPDNNTSTEEMAKKAFKIAEAIDILNCLLWDTFYQEFLMIMEMKENDRQNLMKGEETYPF